MPVTIELPPQEEQLAFNRRRWKELAENPAYADCPEKIETNRFGDMIMSPQPLKPHGRCQSKITALLQELLPDGVTVTESPISTSDGVKGADVTWASDAREAENPEDLYEIAPEICVEVRSPSQPNEKLREKAALYFDAGAEEVWICELDKTMQFYLRAQPDAAVAHSEICPEFPAKVSL